MYEWARSSHENLLYWKTFAQINDHDNGKYSWRGKKFHLQHFTATSVFILERPANIVARHSNSVCLLQMYTLVI